MHPAGPRPHERARPRHAAGGEDHGRAVSHRERPLAHRAQACGVPDQEAGDVLRMQLERMGAGGFVPSLREYASRYGITQERLRPGSDSAPTPGRRSWCAAPASSIPRPAATGWATS